MNVTTRHLAALLFVFSLTTLLGRAQQPAGSSQLPDSPSRAKQSQHETEEQRRIEEKEQSQKILGFIPNYNTTTEKTALPLSPRSKFHLFARSAFSPFEFAAVGFQAGLSQANDEFPDYGQGAEGYGKRYGAAFADQVSSGFFSNFAYPVLFHEDPRYFRSGEGSVSHRFWYSVGQEFVAHKDQGGRRFGFSNVLGAFTSGAISNAYYPERDRTAGDTLSRSAIAVGYGCVGNLASEFWPDVQKKYLTRHRKKKDTDNSQ